MYDARVNEIWGWIVVSNMVLQKGGGPIKLFFQIVSGRVDAVYNLLLIYWFRDPLAFGL